MESPEKVTGEKPVQIPFFVAESMAAHLCRANRRMLTALIVVCLTFIVTIVIFVVGYTIREKNWLDTLINTPGVSEALQNGLHK